MHGDERMQPRLTTPLASDRRAVLSPRLVTHAGSRLSLGGLRRRRRDSSWSTHPLEEGARKDVAERLTEIFKAANERRERVLTKKKDDVVWQKLRKPAAHILFGPGGPYIDPSNIGTGALLHAPPDMGAQRYSFFDIPPRTMSLILSLLALSVLLSVGDIVMVLFPLATDALRIKWVLQPNFARPQEAHEVLRAATVLGQWRLPAQLLLACMGPAGTLLVGTLGFTLSARELGMAHNPQWIGRTSNHLRYGASVLGAALSARALALSGYWTVFRYAPPVVCHILGLLCRAIPQILAAILCAWAPSSTQEVMLPAAVTISVVGTVLGIYFACCIASLRECLPTDNVFVHTQKWDNTSRRRTRIRSVDVSIFMGHAFAHTILMAFPLFFISALPNLHASAIAAAKPTMPLLGRLGSSYAILLTCDALGRFILPVVLDIAVLGPRWGRLSVLAWTALGGIPVVVWMFQHATPWDIGRVFPLVVMGQSIVACIAAIMVSLSRAMFGAKAFTTLMCVSEALATTWCFVLNHVLPVEGPLTQLRIVCGTFILVLISVILLWLNGRDYGLDRWGYPNITVDDDDFGAFGRLVPTASIPVGLFRLAVYERVHRHYYTWNSGRLAPSELRESNLSFGATHKKTEDKKRERQRQLRERVAL